MVFRSIEKPSSAEENKIKEESIGGPWDKNYEGQFDVEKKGEEEKTDLVNPLKETSREEILGKTGKENPPVSSLPFAELHKDEKERFERIVEKSKNAPKINPLTDDEAWKKYKRKISDIRETQAEI